MCSVAGEWQMILRHKPWPVSWSTISAPKNRLTNFLGVMVWLALIAQTSCARVDPVVKVGLVAPFEGRFRPIGYDVIYSARLAVREVNREGGIGGYRVALVSLDDSGDPMLAASTASSLVLDPAVIVVIGHWLPSTTAVAAPIYAEADLPIIATSGVPFSSVDPALLPGAFLDAYDAVTPFDEAAGPFAGPAYDAFQLLWAAMGEAYESRSAIDRAGVSSALSGLAVEGITGEVYQP